MVDLLLAVEPRIPRGALAEVAAVGVVGAAAAVGAGPVCARHGTQLAVVAIETMRAIAGICVFQILRGGRTGFIIGNRLATAAAASRTFVNLNLQHSAMVRCFIMLKFEEALVV